MPTITLVITPCWDVGTPPIGMGYVAQYMRAAGYHVWTYDLNLAGYKEVGRGDLWDPKNQKYWVDQGLFRKELPDLDDFLNRWAQRLADEEGLLIGFSVNAASRYFTVELARRIRERRPDRPLIWGGPGVHNYQELNHIPNNLVDCVVVGEGEVTLLEIANQLAQGNDLPGDLPGTAMPHEDRFRFNPPRPEIADLDSLPFPTYEGFPVDSYVHKSCVPVIVSRGCPMRCSFCDTSQRFKQFRWRSAANVMEEINYHASQREIYSITFHDALINGNIKMLRELIDLFIESELNLQWTGNCVVHKAATQELYQDMARAGCTRLLYGLESGSSRVLKLMNKHYSPEHSASVLRWGHEAGIENWVNFICGFPGESEQEFEETLRFAEQNIGHIHTITAVTVMFFVPETQVYDQHKELGVTLHPHSHFMWTDDKGNTPEVRIARVQKLLDLFAAHDVPVLTHSLNEIDINYGCSNPRTRPEH
jgi:radical SAM superfamily enzyme YgiQ (UPF0313 family)